MAAARGNLTFWKLVLAVIVATLTSQVVVMLITGQHQRLAAGVRHFTRWLNSDPASDRRRGGSRRKEGMTMLGEASAWLSSLKSMLYGKRTTTRTPTPATTPRTTPRQTRRIKADSPVRQSFASRRPTDQTPTPPPPRQPARRPLVVNNPDRDTLAAVQGDPADADTGAAGWIGTRRPVQLASPMPSLTGGGSSAARLTTYAPSQDPQASPFQLGTAGMQSSVDVGMAVPGMSDFDPRAYPLTTARPPPIY